jgi:predicted small lipoprotein YifL
MKKIIVILLTIMVAFSLVGCGKGKTNTETSGADEITQPESESGSQGQPIQPTEEETESEVTIEPSETATPTEEESEEVEVDQGLLNVKITLPASMFEDMTDFDPEAYTEENGFKETVVNENGSITITMSKNKHNELMTEMEMDIDNTLAEMVEAEDTPYIKEITSSEGYRTVTMRVDKEGYENAWDMTPLSIYFNVVFYQVFDDAEPYCEVIVEDIETGEVLYSVIYPDALEE